MGATCRWKEIVGSTKILTHGDPESATLLDDCLPTLGCRFSKAAETRPRLNVIRASSSEGVSLVPQGGQSQHKAVLWLHPEAEAECKLGFYHYNKPLR